MNVGIESVKSQWSALPPEDKRLIRFYLQMSQEDLAKRASNFGDLYMNIENKKRKKEFQHQVVLYTIAYLLKEHKINVKGGGKTRKSKSKRRQTRRRRV